MYNHIRLNPNDKWTFKRYMEFRANAQEIHALFYDNVIGEGVAVMTRDIGTLNVATKMLTETDMMVYHNIYRECCAYLGISIPASIEYKQWQFLEVVSANFINLYAETYVAALLKYQSSDITTYTGEVYAGEVTL